MRTILAAVLVVMAVACHAPPIGNLHLEWRGVGSPPRASPWVSQALAQVPIAFGVRDTRPDPYFVGTHEDEKLPVRTSDDVAAYCSARMGDMLRLAGARFEQPPRAVVEVDLLEYRVDETGRFNGQVVLQVTVHATGAVDWSRTYRGTSHRWGKTHSPDNFNEALSNALADAVGHLFADDTFGQALLAYDGPAPQPGGDPYGR
jgi:hypothetical protein